MAADVYDEWLRSDCAEKIADDLATKAAEKEAKAANEVCENAHHTCRTPFRKPCRRPRTTASAREAKSSKSANVGASTRSTRCAASGQPTTWSKQTTNERTYGHLFPRREATQATATLPHLTQCEEQRAADLRALDAEEKRELAERMAELGGKGKAATVRDTKVYDRFQFLDRTKGFTTTTSAVSREWVCCRTRTRADAPTHTHQRTARPAASVPEPGPDLRRVASPRHPQLRVSPEQQPELRAVQRARRRSKRPRRPRSRCGIRRCCCGVQRA